MHQRAFTLVELSIVLVILGLLIGGVLTGQSLIRAAELRSVSSDIQRYQTALFTFRDKYFALPGDMTNATQYWGTAAGTGSDDTCYSFSSTTSATCNGNGNGRVDYTGSQGNAEPHRFWQHLANAGLIEGSYNGAQAFQNYGTATPKGKISGTSYDIGYAVYGSYWGESWSAASNGNTFFWGTYFGGVSQAAALKPEEQYNIDTKIDDGLPASGKLQSSTLYNAACTTGTYPAVTYALSNQAKDCAIRYSAGI